MEDIILTIIVALSGVAVGFLAGLIKKGRAFVLATETELDDKVLKILDDAIAKSKDSDA